MARHLSASVPDELHAALHEAAARDGVSVAHLVRRLLADALDLDHHSLFQVSTSGALVEGVNDGCVTVGDLRRHGDFGVGTFDGLDGEMVLLDGRCYQARGDGDVVEPDDATLSPFAVVTHFQADRTSTVEQLGSLDDLVAHLDRERSTDNLFVGIKAVGTFARLRLRAACRTELGTPLLVATEHQEEWELRGATGTLVGFWSPTYSRAVAVPGYHLHFLSDDRRQAGHVLAMAAPRLRVELHELRDVHLALPESASFVHADLNRDGTADLDVVEHGTGRGGPPGALEEGHPE